MTTYDKVKEIADKRDLSIAAIEKSVNLANGTIGGWRNGKPYAISLKKVADFLKVPMEELMENESVEET